MTAETLKIQAAIHGEPPVDMPTSKEALGDSAPQRPLDAPSAPPKTFMYASWHKDTNPLKLLFVNPLLSLLHDLMYHGEVPKHTGKLPVISALSQHLWIFPRAVPPMIAHYISIQKGYQWNWLVTYGVYSAYFAIFAVMLSRRLKGLVAKYGYLDGQVARDAPPDIRAASTSLVIVLALFVRPSLITMLAFDETAVPAVTWMTPINIFMYIVILDFYFYIYHRAMHEVDFLWRFHKTHHMSKHPIYVLTGFADIEQDVWDVYIIPLLAGLTYKIGFFDWWLATCYLLHTESMGHSGLRAYAQTPVCSPVLGLFGMDLEIEDHDLHHRNGWRKSFNYGKQTKLWDTLFRTTRPRIECVPENIAW